MLGVDQASPWPSPPASRELARVGGVRHLPPRTPTNPSSSSTGGALDALGTVAAHASPMGRPRPSDDAQRASDRRPRRPSIVRRRRRNRGKPSSAIRRGGIVDYIMLRVLVWPAWEFYRRDQNRQPPS